MKRLFPFLLMCVVILAVGCAVNSVSVSLTPNGTQAIDDGQSLNITATVTNDPASKGVTWTPATLSNQTITSATYIAPATGSGSATITAMSVADPTKSSQPLTINFTPAPTITTASLPDGVVGVAYSQTIAETGGAGTLTYSISLGALPAGLNLNSSTGAITGTPTGPASTTPVSFTVKVIDSSAVAPQFNTKPLSITISQAPGFTSAASTTFTVGVAGTFGVAATGVPTPSLTETGALPAGVTFVDNGNGTATLSGTPAAGTAGSYPIVIKAHNGVGTDATQNFTLTAGQAPTISSGANTTFTVGAAGTFAVTTTGFPKPALTETGALPTGVTFVDNGNGTATLAGTPGAGTGGTYPITIKASNGVLPNGSQNFTLTVDQAPGISSAASTTFTVGAAGTFAVTTTGFPAPALTETGALPAGVTFVDNGNGTATLAGTPGVGTAGNYPITIKASNGVAPNGSQNFTLTVGQAPVISSAASTMFTVGAAGTFAVTTTGFPAPALTETGALPAGVTFVDNGNGTATLAGTPAASTGGTYPITIKASNGVLPNGSQNFTLTVDQAPGISSAASTTLTVGVAGTFTVTTTGFPLPSLTETGALPAGVTFVDNGNGTATLAGTPGAGTAGNYPITIKASNGVLPNGSQNFTLTVGQAPGISSAASTTFTVGAAGTFAVTTTGFPLPSLTETGALPTGVTFVDNGNGTATLSGTPAVGSGGVYAITIKAHNGIGVDPTQNFTLTVDEAPKITSAASTTFSVGAAGTFTVTTTGTPKPTLSEVGALPAGVTFVDNGNGTATLSGTPSASGSFAIVITAHNVVAPDATQNFTLTVNNAPVVTSAANTTFTVGAAGTFTVTTTGVPAPSLTETGALPAGVTFVDNGNGTATLAGTPAANMGGTYPITIKASNGVLPNGSQNFTLTVDQAPGISSAASTTFTVGAAGTFTVTTTGFPKPALTETGALPAGVTFVDNGNGTATLAGTPGVGTAGSYPISIKASNGVLPNGAQSFTLTVNSAPVITSAASTTFTVGLAGTFTVTTTGVPNSTITETGTLPTGVTLVDNGNGTATLSGTPGVGTGGVYSITIKAHNGVGTDASQTFTLTVDEAPKVSSANNTTFTVGSAGTFTVTTTGQPAPSLSEVGALPAGVTFVDNGNGTATLAGTPGVGTAGSYPITIQASNGVLPNGSQSFTLTVSALTTTCNTSLTGKESLLHGDYAFVSRGFDSTGNPAFVGGVFVASGVAGAGNITSGTLDMNLNAGVQSNLSFTSASGYNLGQDGTGGIRGCMSIVTSAGTQHYAFTVDGVGGITAGVASNGHMIDFDTTGPSTAGVLRQATSSAFSTGSITGNWAFGIAGPPASSGNGKFSAAGVLTFSGGSVSGVADTNENGKLESNSLLTAFPATAGITLASGPYSISSNGRGTLQFTPSGSSTAVNLFVYVVSSSEALVMGADSQTNDNGFDGRAFKQSGTFNNSSLSGNHVIYDSGPSTSTPGGVRTELDLVSTSGTNFTFNGYQNDSGSTSDPTSNNGSGTFSVASNGRVTLTCAACGNHLPIFYLYSANNAFFLSSDGNAASGLFVAQTGSSFTASSISGAYGLGTFSPDVSGVTDESGMVTFTPGTTSISGTTDKNAQGTLTPNNPATSTYSVISTGVGLMPSGCTLTGLSANCQNLFIIISPTQAVLMKVKPTSATPAITVLEQ